MYGPSLISESGCVAPAQLLHGPPYPASHRGVLPLLNCRMGPLPSIISGCVAPAQLLHGPPTQHHIGVRCPCSIAAWVFKAAQGRMAPSHHGAPDMSCRLPHPLHHQPHEWSGQTPGLCIEGRQDLGVGIPQVQPQGMRGPIPPRSSTMLHCHCCLSHHLLHPVSKRNMLYTLDRKINGLSAAWVPGFPKPKLSESDDFVRLRIGGIPAGARKLYVTKEACKRIAACGMLVAMPKAEKIAELNTALDRASHLGVGAHVSARYYTKGSGEVIERIDQTSEDIQALTCCAGAFLKIVAPSSTLAPQPSPIPWTKRPSSIPAGWWNAAPTWMSWVTRELGV